MGEMVTITTYLTSDVTQNQVFSTEVQLCFETGIDLEVVGEAGWVLKSDEIIHSIYKVMLSVMSVCLSFVVCLSAK